MNKRGIFPFAAVILAYLAAASPLEARIKLTAVPERGEVTVNLENPAATLIEEERVLTLQEGANQVDFSWRGVRIDPDSIRLAVLSHPDEVRLISVSYPPGEDALVWQVYSPRAVGARVRISYLLSAIDRLVTYRAMVNREETEMTFSSHLVLRNFSGEDFASARLVMEDGDEFRGGVLHEETKEILLYERPGVPLRKVLTWDAAARPWDPEREATNVGIPFSYRFRNEEAAGLGRAALWDGKARLFQEDGRGTFIFLGEDRLTFTPPGGEGEVTVGQSRDVVVTQRLMREEMVNVRRNNNNAIVLHDSDELIVAEIENFSDRAQFLLVRQHIPGQWEERGFSHSYRSEDAGTLEFEIELAPREKTELSMHYLRRNIRPGRGPQPVRRR